MGLLAALYAVAARRSSQRQKKLQAKQLRSAQKLRAQRKELQRRKKLRGRPSAGAQQQQDPFSFQNPLRKAARKA